MLMARSSNDDARAILQNIDDGQERIRQGSGDTKSDDQDEESDAATPRVEEHDQLNIKSEEGSRDKSQIPSDTTAPIHATKHIYIGGVSQTTRGRASSMAGPATNPLQDSVNNTFHHAQQSLKSASSWKSLKSQIGPGTQSSSGSLPALAEQDCEDTTLSIRRSNSARYSAQVGGHRRHSKSASINQPVTSLRRNVNSEVPVYPDQSFAQLQQHVYTPRPSTGARTKSANQQSTTHDHNMNGTTNADQRTTASNLARTADNTPLSSPGLFSPTAVRTPTPLEGDQRSASPRLHHLQAPKETHEADIDHDHYSGNKLINNFEVIREIGRGEHGKVKLGRDIEHDHYVAIKIVPRYSRQRRLGRLGEPQDQTKKEVAILKKARHPNVVSLIEVIDDPTRNKVYLILEYVEHGEIKWRKEGTRIITHINNRRWEAERRGVSLSPIPSEGETQDAKSYKLRSEHLERSRAQQPTSGSVYHYIAEDESVDDENENLERTASTATIGSHAPSRTDSNDNYSHSLAGSMYGPYDTSADRPERKHSVVTALSHMSSEPELDLEDDEHNYVPALTQDDARSAFRDTLLGLEFLHWIGIYHRDIKPANLLVASDKTVKISDFGVSYLGQPVSEQEAEANKDEDVRTPSTDYDLARSVGTPAFWAPELCYDDPSIFENNTPPKITGAIDLWALGVTLYCMIYARLPFYATDEIGLHEAVCTQPVVCPRTRLVAVDGLTDKKIYYISPLAPSNVRADYDLKFEMVSDELIDLIKRLLVVDPARRITIAEAKRHPWVTEGVRSEDVAQFLEPPEVEFEKDDIVKPSDEAIERAVVKKSFLERTISATGRLVGNLLGRPSASRKRAISTVTTGSTSSDSVNNTVSSTSTAVRGRDPRRSSLRGDEVLQAIQKSRENTEHPLAQSQTASPIQEVSSYFELEVPDQSRVKADLPRSTPETELRPHPPSRGLSALSTADSIRTIKASHFNGPEVLEPVPQSDSHSPDASVRARIGGVWEGLIKSASRLSDRSSRSPSATRRASVQEQRASPSVAMSSTYATGSIEAPDQLRALDQESSMSPIEPLSPALVPTTAQKPPASHSRERHRIAQEINQRRQIQEAQHVEDSRMAVRSDEPVTPVDCPPSPDDLIFRQEPQASITWQPSDSTIASSVTDFADSSVTQSASHPSLQVHSNITSGASSPPDPSDLNSGRLDSRSSQPAFGQEPEFMRSADTVRGQRRSSFKRRQRSLDHEDDGDDEQDSSSEEEMIMMGGPRKKLA